MRTIALTLFVILVISPFAWSQATSDVNFFISGGPSIPSGPTNNIFYQYASKEVCIGGGLSYRLTPEIFSVNGIDISSFLWNSANVLHDRAFIFNLTSNIKYLLMQANTSDKSTIAPYLIGGIGLFYMSPPDTVSNINMSRDVSASNADVINLSHNEFALNASIGAGIEVPGGGLPGVFIEVRYAIGFTQPQCVYYIPIRIGLRGNF